MSDSHPYTPIGERKEQRNRPAPWLSREAFSELIATGWRLGDTVDVIAAAVNATKPSGEAWPAVTKGMVSYRAHYIGLTIKDRPGQRQIRAPNECAVPRVKVAGKPGRQPAPVLAIVAPDCFQPMNVNDLEWGAEAAELWGDPSLDDAGVRWLLRPRRAGCGGWGFYLSIDGGRPVSAWSAYVSGDIDVVSLIERARQWFRSCADRDDLASPWRERMVTGMRARGLSDVDVFEAIPFRQDGRRFAFSTVKNALTPHFRPSPELRAAVEAAVQSLVRDHRRAA